MSEWIKQTKKRIKRKKNEENTITQKQLDSDREKQTGIEKEEMKPKCL
jgi:hypothetical protein